MPAVHLQVHQAANQFLERIMPHAAIAVRLHGLGPLGEQAHRLVAHGGVARRAADPRDMPLNHWPKTVSLLRPHQPPIGLPGAGNPAAVAEPVQDVVLGQTQPKIARRLKLLLPAALVQPHADIIERLDFVRTGADRVRQQRAFGHLGHRKCRERRGFQKFAAGHFCFHNAVYSTRHCSRPEEKFSGSCASSRRPSVSTASNVVRL